MLGDLLSEQVFLVMHSRLINGSGVLELIKVHDFTTINMPSVVEVAARYSVRTDIPACPVLES